MYMSTNLFLRIQIFVIKRSDFSTELKYLPVITFLTASYYPPDAIFNNTQHYTAVLWWNICLTQITLTVDQVVLTSLEALKTMAVARGASSLQSMELQVSLEQMMELC